MRQAMTALLLSTNQVSLLNAIVETKNRTIDPHVATWLIHVQ